MKHLVATNPSQLWMQSTVDACVELDNGQTIIVRADLQSVIGEKRFIFTATNVWARWFDVILGERDGETLPLPSVRESALAAEEIANTINKMLLDGVDVKLMHCEAAHDVLRAINLERYVKAKTSLWALGVSLLNYEPEATKVKWGDWIIDCSNYITAQGGDQTDGNERSLL